MMSHFIRLGKDVIAYGVMGGISGLIGIILLPIFTRVFETDEYGILEIVVAFTTLTAILVRLSLTKALARYYYEKDYFEEKSRLISTIFFFLCISGISLVFISLFFSQWLAAVLFDNRTAGNLIVMAVATGFFSALSAVPSMVLRLQRKILIYNIVSASHAITYATLALFLVLKTEMGVAGVVTASMIAAFLQLCLASTFVIDYLTITFSRNEISKCLKFAIPIFPSVFAGWVNKQVDRFILLALLGLSGVGLYGAGAKIGGLILLGTTIFRQAWNPLAMSMLKEEAHIRNLFFRRSFNYFAGLFAILTLALIAITPELFSWLVHADYQEAYFVVPWVAGAAIMQASLDFSSIGAIISEKTLPMSIAAWTGAVINILIGLTLIPIFGISGAAIGSFIAAMTANMLLIANTSRVSSINMDKKVLISIFGIYVVGSLTLLWLSETYGEGGLPLLLRISIFVLLALILLTITIDKKAYMAIRSTLANTPFPGRTTR